MSEKRLLLTILAAVALLAVSAAAQDEKNEVTGIIGRTYISDQGTQGFVQPIRSGKGLSFELNYGRHVLGNAIYGVSLEVPVMFNLDEDLNAGGPIAPVDYRQIFVTPAARVNLFPSTAFSPWVSLGGGFAHFTQNNTLLYSGGANPGKSTTSGVLEAGLGLDVRVWHHFSVRGQVRDFWSGEPDFPLAPTGKTRQHNYFVGGGFVWHF